MQNIDIYGNKINLTLNNSETIKTKFGGFMTIISVFLICSFMWFLGKDIFYKQSPQTTIENNLYDNYEDIISNFFEFPFGVALMDDNNNLINITNFFDLAIEYVRYHSTKLNGSIQMQRAVERNIEANPCNILDFDDKINNTQFVNSQLNYYFCPDFKNLTLKGYWSEQEIKIIAITIKKCNKNDNKECKSEEEINSLIKKNKLNLNINFLQPRIKFNDFDNPITHSVINFYRYLNTNILKQYYFAIQEHSLFTDKGSVFSRTEYEDFYEPVLLGYDELDFNSETKELMVVEIYSSNKNKYYYRNYIKLGNLLGSLGGIIKIFSALFIFLNSIFGRIRFFEVIINELFLIKENNKVGNKRNIYSSEYIDLNNFSLISKREFSNAYLLNTKSENFQKSINEDPSFDLNLSKNGQDKNYNKNVDLFKFTKIESQKQTEYDIEKDVDNVMNNEKNKFIPPKSFVEDLNKKKKRGLGYQKNMYDMNVLCKEDYPFHFNKNKINFQKVNFSNHQKPKKLELNLKKNYEDFYNDMVFNFEKPVQEGEFLVDIKAINKNHIKDQSQNKMNDDNDDSDSKNSESFKYTNLSELNGFSKKNENTKLNYLKSKNENGKHNQLSDHSKEREDEKNIYNLILLNDIRLQRILDNLKKKDQKNKVKLNLAEIVNFFKVRFFGIDNLKKKFYRNYKIFYEGEKKISQYLNLIKIINKFENIDFISKILLDDYQKSILDIINLPTLDISETKFKFNDSITNHNKFNKKYVYGKRKINDLNICSKENIEAINIFLTHFDEDKDSINKNIFKKLIE